MPDVVVAAELKAQESLQAKIFVPDVSRHDPRPGRCRGRRTPTSACGSIGSRLDADVHVRGMRSARKAKSLSPVIGSGEEGVTSVTWEASAGAAHRASAATASAARSAQRGENGSHHENPCYEECAPETREQDLSRPREFEKLPPLRRDPFSSARLRCGSAGRGCG